MKKIFFVLAVFLFCYNLALADIMPTYMNSIKYYGMGVLNVWDSFPVYEKQSEHSKVLKRINYEEFKNSSIMSTKSSIEDTIVAYCPSSKISLVAVETNNEDGWFEIYYDQKNGLTGWVKHADTSNFKTWRDLFYIDGKKNGIYFFKDIPEEVKRMHVKDDEQSQRLENFTQIKFMNFSIIRGNWMLVSILDAGPSQRTKIGWMKWRSDDGKLYMFPNLK